MLQSISSVFIVYRCKTLTGSLDPTHANSTDKPCTTTVNRNYNEAMKYHKLRKCKKSKKTDESAEPREDKEEEIEMSETSEEFSDEEVKIQGETTAEVEGEMPKLPLVPKLEPTEQLPPPKGE